MLDVSGRGAISTKKKLANFVIGLASITIFVALCGLPKAEKLQGQSLVPLIRNPEMEWTKPVLSTWYYKNHAVRSENWRYIQYRDGSEELYDHRIDPGEHTNLALNPKYAHIIAEHKKWLPETDALPAGASEWKPDKLDRRIEKWLSTDSVPDWLK